MIRSSNATSGFSRATSRAASRNRPSENFMMLALCPAVTLRRPFALAYSNANRAILRLAVSLIALIDRPESCRTRLPVVRSMKAISSAVGGAPCSSSIPVYEPSVSSRTTTTSARSYRDRTPGYSLHGRTAAYRPRATRSPTFTLRKPAGVASGPFRATRVPRIDSITRGGSGVPSASMTESPAGWTSQSIATPVASTVTRAASRSSGPAPSPGINVIRCTVTRRL
jgi:hypothetical protein